MLILFLSLITLIISGSYIKNGITEFDKFLNLEISKTYLHQYTHKTCKSTDGPRCFFFKKNHTKITNKNLTSKIQKLSSKINDYKTSLQNSRDAFQNPPSTTLKLLVSFETFDQDTINNNKIIYMPYSKDIGYFSESVTLIVEGKLRLTYLHKQAGYLYSNNYPSGTIGIIESKHVTFRIKNKRFKCTSFYIKPHKGNSANYKLYISAYDNEAQVYGQTHTMTSNEWYKVTFPNIYMTRLILPQGYEIDNLMFTFETVNQYDISVQFYNDRNYKYEELITEDDLK